MCAVPDKKRRQNWVEGGLQRWEDRGGWYILLVALCEQGRAAVVDRDPKKAAGNQGKPSTLMSTHGP